MYIVLLGKHQIYFKYKVFTLYYHFYFQFCAFSFYATLEKVKNKINKKILMCRKCSFEIVSLVLYDFSIPGWSFYCRQHDQSIIPGSSYSGMLLILGFVPTCTQLTLVAVFALHCSLAITNSRSFQALWVWFGGELHSKIKIKVWSPQNLYQTLIRTCRLAGQK